MMATSLDLHSLEQYCETLYNPPSQQSRIQVENLLNYHFPTFSKSLGPSSSDASSSTSNRNSSSPIPGTHSPSISTPVESALLCRNLLENTNNPYALMFATARLKVLAEDHFLTFTTAEQHGLRSFVLQFIYQNPGLPTYIITTQAQLFATLTKLGWIENDDFRLLLDSIQVFFQRTIAHRILGLRLLTATVVEMNLTDPKNAGKQRKIAVGFRDAQLLPITKSALAMLQVVLQNSGNDEESHRVKEMILTLLRAAFSFDFIGTVPDESSDDVGSIQIPIAWRAIVEEPGYLDVLWAAWKKFTGAESVLAMECLSQAATIRRSVFTSDDTRQVYIHHMMREILNTLQSAQGQQKLQDLGNFHEFCRMLSRFRNTFQMLEITEYKDFQQWISAVGQFSSRGLHAWKWSPNSVAYLLGFWGKMVSSMSSAKQGTAEYILDITVELSSAYVKSRLECVHAVVDGEVDDPLENEEDLITTLESLATMARSKYVESGKHIIAQFQDLVKKNRQLIQQAMSYGGSNSPPLGSSDIKEQIMITDMKLAWMVYIIGSCIGGRTSYQSTSEQDQVDGEMTCEVLSFIHQHQMWIQQRPLFMASPDAHLYVHSAIIFFYTQFRQSYIGEESSKSVKVYTQLAERWGLNTPNQVLDIIMSSSLSNLQSCGDPDWRQQEDQLVVRTLKLFTNLAAGYSSVKHIRKLDTTKALLKNHAAPEFRFLQPRNKTSDAAVGRSRMNYYSMLARILFAEDEVDKDFWQFIKPWEQTLDRVMLTFEGKSNLGKEEIRLMLLGIFKDMRGFVYSISNRKQFALFFEWFFPAYTPIVLQAIEIWPQDELGIAIMRFWQEFVTNRTQRVTFDSCSPNGILLFRDTSKLLYSFGQSLLSRPLTNMNNKWSEKYKGIMLYFNVLASSMSGKYANFGVFKLYGDKALDHALETFFSLMLAIPVDDMIAFPKLSLAYFSVVDVFTSDHMTELPMMPPTVLSYMFQAMGEIMPIPSQDTACSTLACSAIDRICSFVLNWIIKEGIRSGDDDDQDLSKDGLSNGSTNGSRHSGEYQRNLRLNSTSPTIGPGSSVFGNGDGMSFKRRATSHWLVDYMMANKDILSYLFSVLFQVVIFENRSNQWSLSRPLLGLILLNRDFFADYTNSFVAAQLPDRQEPIQKAIAELMEGVEDNLSTANRNLFTQRTNELRRTCTQMTLMSIRTEDVGGM